MNKITIDKENEDVSVHHAPRRRSPRDTKAIRFGSFHFGFYKNFNTLFFNQPSEEELRVIGGRHLINQESMEPNIYTITNFLSLEAITELTGVQVFERSFVEDERGVSLIDSSRTSTVHLFDKVCHRQFGFDPA